MTYNANRTIQAVCAKAVIMQTEQHAGSCNNIAKAAALAWVGFETEDKIKRDYRIHSGAYMGQYGFFPFSLAGWLQIPTEAKQTYRLEMLYYFWLANQDGMDAFS